MFSRFRFALAMALTLALVLTIPVFAGGWAVITLDELPTNVVAGEPITVGFTVLQHGRTPVAGLDATITAKLSRSESFVARAQDDGKPGHYTATLTFPKEGEWEWVISAFGEQPMPALHVAAGSASSANQPVAEAKTITPSISLIWIARALALVVGAAGVVIVFRNKSRLAYGLVMLSLGVGIGSFVTGSTVPEAEGKVVEAAPVESSMSQAELGQQLFVTKGCVTCHVNRKVSNSDAYWTIEMGAPDLTKFSASPEALRIRLKDPAMAKSDTQMPNLNLKEDEIEALIAFINSK